MDIESFLGAVIGGAVVWAFSELTHRRRSAEARRIAFGQVLSDLAEVRYRLGAIMFVGQLCDRFSKLMSAEEIAYVKRMLVDIIPPMPDLHTRLDEALRLVAGTDPGLAFRMRSKDQVETVLNRWYDLFTKQADSPEALRTGETMRDAMAGSAAETLDEAILELAKLHGTKTHADFESRVKRWNDRIALYADFKKDLIEKVPQLSELFAVLDSQTEAPRLTP